MSDVKKRSASLADTSTAAVVSTKIVTSKVLHLVTTCRNCHMVYISDRKRIICPFCGSFYQEKSVDDFLRHNDRTAKSRNLMNQVSLISFKIRFDCCF